MINKFSSLIEVMIGINLAFTALKQIKDTLLGFIGEKINNLPLNLEVAKRYSQCSSIFDEKKTTYLKEIEESIEQKYESLKKNYIVAAIYGLIILIYIGVEDIVNLYKDSSIEFFFFNLIMFFYILYLNKKNEYPKIDIHLNGRIIIILRNMLIACAIFILFWVIGLIKPVFYVEKNQIFDFFTIMLFLSILFAPFLISYFSLRPNGKEIEEGYEKQIKESDCYELDVLENELKTLETNMKSSADEVQKLKVSIGI